MIYVGDYIALGLVMILTMFYFESRNLTTLPSKFFAASLIMTGCTALTDIVSGWLLAEPGFPVMIRMHANSLYFVVNILTTSCFAMYLFSKVLEHVYDDHCMGRGKTGLAILFIIFVAFIIANYRNHWLFYFDESGIYRRGPLNPIGYIVTVMQMCLVMICYFRNRNSTGKSLNRSLKQSFPVILLCIIIQLGNQEIMLNGLIMAMTCLIIYLNFQGQRQGEHSLTKLNDRHSFYRDIEQRINAEQRFQILEISIRDFGMINQKYGHKVGDEILYQCAFALEKLIPHVSAFHIGATDFALVFPYLYKKAAKENLEILTARAAQGVVYKDETICPDHTVIEYISDTNDQSVTDVFEKLEYASAIAKAEKKKYILCTAEMGREMHRRRYLIERLSHPDREHGFRVWFQPVYCRKTGQFCSMEALMRLVEPDGTMIPPDEFITVAEQTGQINGLTWFVVEETCAFLAANPDINTSVSINLPMPQLFAQDFEKKLSGIVDKYGVDRSRICLEVTERAFLEDFDACKAVMHAIADAGYRFFLDDFGTGYSNFSCLLQLPFTCIKLDRSLSQDIDENATTRNMVRTLTGLFHDMGFQVIAEGAETSRQVETLSENSVDRIQGYFYAKPMRQSRVVEFYRSHSCRKDANNLCSE